MRLTLPLFTAAGDTQAPTLLNGALMWRVPQGCAT